MNGALTDCGQSVFAEAELVYGIGMQVDSEVITFSSLERAVDNRR
jgi:hypothetical protein